MLTEQTIAQATQIIANLKAWRQARSDAERIVQAQAHAKNGDGLTVRLSESIVSMIRNARIKECDLAIAELYRRAAQIDLKLEQPK